MTPTKPVELPEDVEKRFDKQFFYEGSDVIMSGARGYTSPASIKSVKEFVAQELAQAHQSGVEEERRRKIEKDYGFYELVTIAETMLNMHYPSDIFSGLSKDRGDIFVTKLREALQALTNKEEQS